MTSGVPEGAGGRAASGRFTYSGPPWVPGVRVMAALLGGWGHGCHLPCLGPRGLLSLSELFDWGGGIHNAFPLVSHRGTDTSTRAAERALCCCPSFSACFAEHRTVPVSLGLRSGATGLWVEVGKLTSL